MDWPVYDAENDIYVQWSEDTSHFESMLELSKTECEQLRCVSIFIPRMEKERGKHRTAPHYNYKKLSISYGRWEEQLAEKRCLTPKARAAQRWLYATCINPISTTIGPMLLAVAGAYTSVLMICS